MNESKSTAQFEQIVLPHLDAAYNLARWLTGNDYDAQDVMQDASLRAFKFLGSFRGGSSRSWLLTIVRNTFYTWLEKNRPHAATTEWNEEIHAVEDPAGTPYSVVTRTADAKAVREAIEGLPLEFREVVVLRELEDYSYKEIASVTGVPIGTVMSRIARARKHLQQILSQTSEAGDIL